MANTKANIQNIPLTGTLNFNTLKTDVKPFNGYNEKNSTVFGGALGPFYDKTTELYDADSSYTLFNSNGDPFTLVKHNSTSGFTVVNKDGTQEIAASNGLCITKKLVNLPNNTVWAAQFTKKGPNNDYKSVCQFAIVVPNSVVGYSLVYYRTSSTEHALEDIDNATWNELSLGSGVTIGCDISEAAAYFNPETEELILGFCGFIYDSATGEAKTFHSYSLWGHFSGETFVRSHFYHNQQTLSVVGPVPCISITGDDIHFASDSGKLDAARLGQLKLVNHTTSGSATTTFWLYSDGNFASDSWGSSSIGLGSGNNRTLELYQFAARRNEWPSDKTPLKSSVHTFYNDGSLSGSNFWTGNDSNGFIPSPITNIYYPGFASYNGGTLLSLSTLGKWSIPITYPTNFSDNLISWALKLNNGEIDIQNINYKGSGNVFYCFICINPSYYNSKVSISSRLRDMTINNRYVILGSAGIYDIEEQQIVKGSQYLGYVETGIPAGGSNTETKYVAQYGGGYNAGYQVNNNNFLGFRTNPVPLANCPSDCTYWNYTIEGDPDTFDIQRYFTAKEEISFPYYIGSSSLYAGTYMPTLTSVIIPYTLDSRMTTGYGNNNFIQIDTTSFFLATFNNNTNLYASFKETRTENITGVFAIQAQRYVTDDNNVYLANYAYGTTSNVFTVGAYKKNLRYIGSLPTMAIFWSDFNKSFYSFTGDSIVRKYFEASDINEIYYVGQNPSSQSIWICTDKGIFIISDNDQYKLDYISQQIDFKKDHAVIVTKNNNNKWEQHRVALYKADEDYSKIPIRIKTCFYGIGNNSKANFDCWYIRVYDPNRERSYIKGKVHTITDVSCQTEIKEKIIEPSEYDENNIAYIKFQPKYQEAVAIQLELESDVPIYQLDLGINANSPTAQLAHNNF